MEYKIYVNTSKKEFIIVRTTHQDRIQLLDGSLSETNDPYDFPMVLSRTQGTLDSLAYVQNYASVEGWNNFNIWFHGDRRD